MPNKFKPFNQPTAGHAYRLLAVDEQGTLYVRDFELSKKQEALKAVDDSKYSSSVLFNEDRDVVAGKMAETDIARFPEVFNSRTPDNLVIQLGH